MKTPLTPSDLTAFVGVGAPRISPDGATVYFRRATYDAKKNATPANIWRVAATGGEPGAFTSGTNDRLACVSPDGTRVAFVGDRDGSTRLLVISTGGGEAVPLGEPIEGPKALEWSPDSTRLLLAAAAPHDPASAPIYHDEVCGVRHIRRLPFKSDGEGLLDGRRTHAFVVDAASGARDAITHGDYDVAAPVWSPDGTQIAFAAQIDAPEDAFSSDIHVVDVATKARRALTSGGHQQYNPAWSHDGARIACMGQRHGDESSGRFNEELFVIDVASAAIRSLSAPLDRTVGNSILGDLRYGGGESRPVWSADDREILAVVSDEGASSVRAFAVDGGAVRVVAGGERDVYGFAYAPHANVCAIVYSTPAIPNDIAVVDAAGAERRLTSVNEALLAERIVAAPRRFRPEAADGVTLDGWLLVPPDAPAPMPLVLEVHGGPHAAYGWSFFFEFQILVGCGFAVAYGNPRGGQSYGHAYADAITGDWGGVDASDCLTILDGALALGDFDRKRIGVAGGSYGGFMTTWLLGHSDRFAAGVSMRAVNEFTSEVGASDLGWFLEREVGAFMADDGGRKLFDMSPMRAAAAIDAPLLVEHSERDYRCPIDQGEQLFSLLRRMGKKDVEFVRFIGDGHDLSRNGSPRNRILRLRAIAQWFVRHLRPHGATPAPDEAGGLFRPLAAETDALPPPEPKKT